MAEPAFGVYVHWPFCRSKCPYCDFNSHVRERIDEARWREALLAELAHAARASGARAVDTVFFGGGTPSLMDPATVAAVLDRIAALWGFGPDPEITLEANPGSVEAGRFQGYRAAGVNRVSLGVQALDDASLKALGRAHSAGEADAAIRLAQAVFPRASFDLIYARPGQTVGAWVAELDRALVYGTEHLSLYQLTIEPGTRFHTLVALGELAPLVDDAQADLYEATQERMERAGLVAYEVSNHARAGAACRHNLIYWRSGDVVGVGPGAHGRLTTPEGRRATARHRLPETWLAAVEREGHGTAEEAVLAPEEATREALLMGLRLAEGLDAGRFRRATGGDLWDAVDGRALDRLGASGFIVRTRDSLRATPKGRQVLNSVLAALAD